VPTKLVAVVPTCSNPRVLCRLVAIGILGLAAGCLGEPNLPACTDGRDETCQARGDGYCRCSDGLCFKSDCPSVTCDTNQGDRTTAVGCTTASTTLDGSFLGPLSVASDGTIRTLNTAGVLIELDRQLMVTRTTNLGLPTSSTQVVVAHAGAGLVSNAGAIEVVNSNHLTLSADGMALVSAPISHDDGYLVLTESGRLLSLSENRSPLQSEPLFGAPVASASLVLTHDAETLWATVSGVGLVRIDLQDVSTAVAQIVCSDVLTPPAIRDDGVVVAAGASTLVAVTRDGTVVSHETGHSPLPPVIHDIAIIVAYSDFDQIEAFDLVVKKQLARYWFSETLSAFPTVPVTLGEADIGVVGLADGRLQSFSIPRSVTTAPLGWYVDFGSALAGPPAQQSTGDWVVLTTDGQVRSLHGVPATRVPWPRLRADSASSGRQSSPPTDRR
jgi:hypothetical protein